MADQQRLKIWLIENSEKYNIEFTELTWTKEIIPVISDFECSIIFRSKKFIGRGSAFGKDLAMIKAFVEAFEGILVGEMKLKNSSGLAGHTNPLDAKLNSQRELIERDTFLCHFLTGLKFPETTAYTELIESALNAFSKHKVTFSFYELSLSKTLDFSMVVASGASAKDPWGMIMSTAVESGYENAQLKAFIEASRAVSHKIFKNDPLAKDIEEEPGFAAAGLKEHAQNALALNYIDKFRSNFKKSRIIPEYLSPEKITSELLNFDILLEFKAMPLSYFISTAVQYQPLYFGHNKSGANLNRLQNFLGSNQFDLPTFLHPLR